MSVAHRTYARALFEAAKEHDRLDRVGAELGQFAEAVREVPELKALLLNPQLDPRAKVSALRELLGDADELVRNFVLTVVEKGRGGEIEEIHREFERLAAADEGRIEVELTTAIELSDDDARSIVQRIEGASGRPVDATRTVEPDLIGGIVMQVGSLRLDSSVRGRLNRLRRELVARK